METFFTLVYPGVTCGCAPRGVANQHLECTRCYKEADTAEGDGTLAGAHAGQNSLQKLSSLASLLAVFFFLFPQTPEVSIDSLFTMV